MSEGHTEIREDACSAPDSGRSDVPPLHESDRADTCRRWRLQSLASAFSDMATPLSRKSNVRDRLRDNNFDALRVIFASMVVFFHIGILTGQPALAWMQHLSATFAVQGFFVVSGFLVSMSFERSSSLSSYWGKRIRRIGPAYITIVVVASVFLASFSTYSVSRYFASAGFWDYLANNLLLMNFRATTLPGVFKGNPISAVNGSLWTIKVEVGFYIAVPIIVWLIRKYGWRTILGVVFLGSVVWHLVFGMLGAHDPVGLYARLAKQLPGELSFFAGGAWAYYRVLEGRSPSFLLAAVGTLAYALTSGLVLEVVAPFAVVALVSWVAIAGPKLPPLGRHGDFSYGIYLYHFPIVQVLIAVGLFAWSPYTAVLVAIVAVLCCSVVSWFFIESPALSGHAQHALRSRRSLAS